MIVPLVDELRLADNNLQRAIFAAAPDPGRGRDALGTGRLFAPADRRRPRAGARRGRGGADRGAARHDAPGPRAEPGRRRTSWPPLTWGAWLAAAWLMSI